MVRGNYAAYCIFGHNTSPNLLRRLESIRDGNEDDIASLHETLSSRKHALCAVRERLGVPTLDGEPCEHCGAHLSFRTRIQRDVLQKSATSLFQGYRAFRHHCKDYTHGQIRKHRSFAKKVVHTTAV